LRAGRHAVGRPRGRDWWCLARGNISAAKRAGALADGMVLPGHPPGWSTARIAGVAGQVRLVLTALRVHSHQPSAASLDVGGTRLVEALVPLVPLLRPDSHVIITAPSARHENGTLLNTASTVLAATRALGLILSSRCVAITAPIRGDRLIICAGGDVRRAVHRAGRPVCLVAHHNVWIFQPRAGADRVATHCHPTSPTRRAVGPRPSAGPSRSTRWSDAGRRAAA